MRILGWIRLGDKAACGATVAEGYDHTRLDGVPYSFQGARMNCAQQCVIAEAIDFFALPNGRKVPHHGHRTSAGCPLHSTANDRCGYGVSPSHHIPAQYIPDGKGGWLPCSHDLPYDISFVVTDERTRQPIPNMPYLIVLENGRTTEGRTDSAGRTEVVYSLQPEHATLTVPYYGNVSTTTDTGLESSTCDR